MNLPTNIKIIILIFALIFCKEHPLLVALAAIYYFSTLNFEMKDKVVLTKLAKDTLDRVDKNNRLSSKVRAWVDNFKKENSKDINNEALLDNLEEALIEDNSTTSTEE